MRYAEGTSDRLGQIIDEFVAAGVEMIVTAGSPAIRAAQAGGRGIPIVSAGTSDLLGLGFIASLARPGGNVTGSTQMYPEIGMKQVELLTDMVRSLSRITVLPG